MGEYITIGLAAISFIVWLIRLEGKINKNYQEYNDHKDKCRETHMYLRETCKEIKEDAKEFNKEFDTVTGEMYKVINKLENIVSELKGFMDRRGDK